MLQIANYKLQITFSRSTFHISRLALKYNDPKGSEPFCLFKDRKRRIPDL